MNGRTARGKKNVFISAAIEVYREYDGAGADITLERETLHVMDDKQRVALVETRTQGSDGLPVQLTRYQCGNHLGSVSLELDDAGNVISYEEYYPYGSTSYQAGRSAAEVSLKRYRYTDKERDEETGLYYHGARYYASWLGRWVSCDPRGLRDGPNLYQYCLANPIRLRDPSGSQSEENKPRIPQHIFPKDRWQFHLGEPFEHSVRKEVPPVPGPLLPRTRWHFHLGEPFEYSGKPETSKVPQRYLPSDRWQFSLDEPAAPFSPAKPFFRPNAEPVDVSGERTPSPPINEAASYRGVLSYNPVSPFAGAADTGPPKAFFSLLNIFNEKIVKGSTIPDPSKASAVEVETRAPSGFGPAAGLKISLDNIPALGRLNPPKLLSLDRFAISGPSLGSELNVPGYTQQNFPIILPSAGMGVQLNYYLPGYISNRKDTSTEHASSSDWPNSISFGVGQAGTTLYYGPYTSNFSFPGIKSDTDPNLPQGVLFKFGFTHQF